MICKNLHYLWVDKLTTLSNWSAEHKCMDYLNINAYIIYFCINVQYCCLLLYKQNKIIWKRPLDFWGTMNVIFYNTPTNRHLKYGPSTIKQFPGRQAKIVTLINYSVTHTDRDTKNLILMNMLQWQYCPEQHKRLNKSDHHYQQKRDKTHKLL